jgi:hypothetical protein
VYTDIIWDENAWSDPIYFDNPGFDQDVSFLSASVKYLQRYAIALLG